MTKNPLLLTTPFQEKVYQALKHVPKGKVTTYKRLASFIGCASAQAIGGALRKNPFAPEIPCHRVVNADLSIGGFFGRQDADIKRQKRALLEQEGVTFDRDGHILKHHLFEF
jgi:methylated-DNA-[protein]-cysteine S-methyltransferase